MWFILRGKASHLEGSTHADSFQKLILSNKGFPGDNTTVNGLNQPPNMRSSKLCGLF